MPLLGEGEDSKSSGRPRIAPQTDGVLRKGGRREWKLGVKEGVRSPARTRTRASCLLTKGRKGRLLRDKRPIFVNRKNHDDKIDNRLKLQPNSSPAGEEKRKGQGLRKEA